MFRHLKKELGLRPGLIGFEDNEKRTSLNNNIPSDIVEWTAKIRKIRGKAFDFDNREYLLPIYRDINKEILIVKPRQMEITEFAVNFLCFHLTTNPGTVGLYLSDRQDHVSAFSKMRLRSWAIDQSPILQSLISKQGNVSWQPFTNGSHLWMLSSWGDFERARSLPADFVVVDEIQSTNVEAVPVLKETLSKSPFGRFVGIGTGSDEGDYWWKLWHTGNQQEWDSGQKKWVPKNPSSEISSYHLTQYMASWITPGEIQKKKDTYTPRRFLNEVEGWWYRSAVKPLVANDILALFDKSISMLRPEDVDHSLGPLYMGVDWGGGNTSDTVAWIWQLVDKYAPRFRVVYVERIRENSTEKQADYVSKLLQVYNVKQSVMDAGGGTRQVQKLEELFGSRFMKCSYMVRPGDPFEINSSENRVAVDRTWAIETIIDLILRPQKTSELGPPIYRMIIPAGWMEAVDYIIDHFACMEGESIRTSSGKKYLKYTNPPGTNDDALHACIYAYLAWLVGEKAKWAWV